MHCCAEGQPQRIVPQSTLGHDGVTWSRNAKTDKQVTHLLGIAKLHSLQHHLCNGCQNMRIDLMWRHFWTKSVPVRGAQRKLRIAFSLGSLWFKCFNPIQGKELCRQMVPAVRTARALLSRGGATEVTSRLVPITTTASTSSVPVHSPGSDLDWLLLSTLTVLYELCARFKTYYINF